MLRSVLQELEKIFYSDFNLTASKPFRTENDILPIHLFSYYSLIKKIGKPKYLNTVRKQKTFFPEFKITSCNYTFSHVNLEQIDQKLNHLINAKPFIFCLNQTPLTTKQHIDIMQSFLKDYFPEKSTFEK